MLVKRTLEELYTVNSGKTKYQPPKCSSTEKHKCEHEVASETNEITAAKRNYGRKVEPEKVERY